MVNPKYRRACSVILQLSNDILKLREIVAQSFRYCSLNDYFDGFWAESQKNPKKLLKIGLVFFVCHHKLVLTHTSPASEK
jgi:hypothetical protein